MFHIVVRRTNLVRVVVATSHDSVIPEVEPGSVVEAAVTSVAAVHAARQQLGRTQLGDKRRSTGDTQTISEGGCRRNRLPSKDNLELWPSDRGLCYLQKNLTQFTT